MKANDNFFPNTKSKPEVNQQNKTSTIPQANNGYQPIISSMLCFLIFIVDNIISNENLRYEDFSVQTQESDLFIISSLSRFE